MAKADIIFKIDSNGELIVKAVDRETKASTLIEIRRPNTFTKDDVEKMALEIDSLDSKQRLHDNEILLKTTESNDEHGGLRARSSALSVYGENLTVHTDLALNDFPDTK